MSGERYPIIRLALPEVAPYPGRRRQQGHMGPVKRALLQPLADALAAVNVTTLVDAYINVAEDRPPYPLNMAIVAGDRRIDVEVDAPYDRYRQPQHYRCCGDDYRDQVMNRHGWTVVRLAERQLKEEPAACILYLKSLIAGDGSNTTGPKPVARWTRCEALKMAARREREQYLCTPLADCEDYIVAEHGALPFNALEYEAQQHITPWPRTADMTQKMQHFTDAGRYAQDDRIDFLCDEHIYLRDGRHQLLPVSTLISYFFDQFDALTQAEVQWERYGTPVEQSLDLWNRVGRMASEVGTFMHAQTENYFQHGVFDTDYTFRDGDTTEHVSIQHERDLFMQFVRDYDIQPYRQEWPVFDADLNLAGTIDLICREADGTFTIYDWKRSRKVVDEQGCPITEAFGSRTAHYGIDLPDTAYHHYCMQQNLYRYMLGQHYGIHVARMYLVVLCPDYDRYHCVDVPPMDDMIRRVISHCQQYDLGRRLL